MSRALRRIIKWSCQRDGCRTGFLFLIQLAAVFVLSAPAAGEAASTWSFTNTPGRGSHPGALVFESGEIRVDISSIPDSAEIYRAVLVPHRRGNTFNYKWNGAQRQEVRVEPDDGQGTFLKLRGPDFLTLDATDSVRRAVREGKRYLRLKVAQFPFLGQADKAEYLDEKTGRPVIRLDVTSDQDPLSSIPAVSGITAVHRDGGTMITWKDPAPLTDADTLASEDFPALRGRDENPREIRYRIYRLDEPITPATIGKAERVGETDALSVWDWRYFAHGRNFGDVSRGQNVPRYPVSDGEPAEHDMGLFVFSPRQAAESYYAVVRAIDGEEDLSQLIPGSNSTQVGVKEAPGSGLVLLRDEVEKEKWRYVQGVSNLKYYVKWEAPPGFNTPEPFDYLVVTPEKAGAVERPPLSVALHEWGGSLNRGWLWSYNLNKYGAIHVSTNQHPYDWWTGFHENLWTLKPLTDEAGSVQPFTQRRLRSFLDDFVIPEWNIDTERILLHGSSMGGAGASLWGIKTGDYFANLTSFVGVHIPAETPQFVSSFANVYGPIEAGIEYLDSGMSAWDYEDNTRWLRDNLLVETPHISFSNGRNDGAIGWPQAWKFARALVETKRPFTFKWGMGGHGERPYHMGDVIDFKLHQSVPAFSGGTLDDDLGAAPENAVKEGQVNYHYRWETSTIEDTESSWAITLYLHDKAPASSAEVHMTPRRLQNFRTHPGQLFEWTNSQNGEVIQEGTATADNHGLVTLRSVRITRERNRIKVWPSEKGPDVVSPGQVDDLRVSHSSPDSLSLAWTSPGDDGEEGTAASYDIRFSTVPLNADNWNEADRLVSTPLPLKAGSLQEVSVPDLVFGQEYHLALRAVDDAGNQSPLSNVVSAETSATNREIRISNRDQLYAALKNLESYTTLILAEGTYDLNRALSFGMAWSKDGKPLTNVTLRGEAEDAGGVVLQGPGMSRNQEPKILVRVRYSRNFTLENLTLRGAYFHLVQIHGEDDADGIHFNNVHLLDAGQQLVKVSKNKSIARFADGGVIENSFIAFSDHARYSPDILGGAYYTHGIDVLGGSDWVIRKNRFENIRAPHDSEHPSGLAGPAVLMWQGTRDATVVGNTFRECDFGITFGLTAGDDPDHVGGVIAHNEIYREGPGDVGISLNKTRGVQVLANKVFLHGTFPWTIEERRLAKDAKNRPTLIKNNITDGPIKLRDRGYAILEDNVVRPATH